jgi:Fur family peroxide stress response transcriptional regulator
MKYSKQREMIFNCIKANPRHLTADAIYEILKKDHPNLSLGTVYRNLSQLSDHQMIKKISIPGQPDRFDGTLNDHYHFYCVECGKVEDLFLEELLGIDRLVAEKTGMMVESVEMSFKGVCAKDYAALRDLPSVTRPIMIPRSTAIKIPMPS